MVREGEGWCIGGITTQEDHIVDVARGRVSQLHSAVSSACGVRDGADARAAIVHGLQPRRSEESTMRYMIAALYATLTLSCLGAPAAWAQSGAHMMATSDELKWTDISSLPAGAKLAVIEGPLNEAVPFTFRLKFPANYQIPAHWHPAIEHVTVISGTFHMGVGDKLDQSNTKGLSAGSVAIMQPKTNHFGWTKEETVVQVHGVGPWAITYVNPADDPRKQ
jgi:hypothetical protein